MSDLAAGIPREGTSRGVRHSGPTNPRTREPQERLARARAGSLRAGARDLLDQGLRPLYPGRDRLHSRIPDDPGQSFDMAEPATEEPDIPTSCLGLRLTPHGHLVAETAEVAPAMDEQAAARLTQAFARGSGYGLLRLGAAELGEALPPAFAWWREFAARYIAGVCLQSANEGASSPSVPPLAGPPTEADLARLVLIAPMMPGSEYLSADILRALWAELGTAFAASLAAAKADLQSFLKALHPAWNLVGRVHFN